MTHMNDCYWCGKTYPAGSDHAAINPTCGKKSMRMQKLLIDRDEAKTFEEYSIISDKILNLNAKGKGIKKRKTFRPPTTIPLPR